VQRRLCVSLHCSLLKPALNTFVAFLLDNGSMYHVAHSLAIFEYLVTIYFKPSWKAHPYITAIGMFTYIACPSRPPSVRRCC
jgi:ABC-type transport system involved in multi-copper enzyme maturation permease subunit